MKIDNEIYINIDLDQVTHQILPHWNCIDEQAKNETASNYFECLTFQSIKMTFTDSIRCLYDHPIKFSKEILEFQWSEILGELVLYNFEFQYK